VSDSWLSVPQIVSELGVCQRTVYRAIRNGRLKACRFGTIRTGKRTDNRDFRVTREWLDDYIRESTVVVRKVAPARQRGRIDAGLMETARRQAAGGSR
jgi:excisionase family DNA binding protein